MVSVIFVHEGHLVENRDKVILDMSREKFTKAKKSKSPKQSFIFLFYYSLPLYTMFVISSF